MSATSNPYNQQFGMQIFELKEPISDAELLALFYRRELCTTPHRPLCLEVLSLPSRPNQLPELSDEIRGRIAEHLFGGAGEPE